MDVRRFHAIFMEGESPVMNDQNNFKREALLVASRRRWALLRKWCAGIVKNARFADISFALCKQKVLCCRQFSDATDAKEKVKDEDLQLR